MDQPGSQARRSTSPKAGPMLLAIGLSLASACADDQPPWVAVDAARPDCIDGDGDGYGAHCGYGADCDDEDPAVTSECRRCARPEPGCPCDRGQPPLPCFEPPVERDDGSFLCREGTRYCRDGVFGACEDQHSYVERPDPELASAINDGLTPEQCDPCRVNCFLIKEPGSQPDAGLVLADGGGFGLPLEGDAGPPADAGGGTITVDGPLSGCSFGLPPDRDCDGIPDSFDESPQRTPLPGTANQAVFLRLGPGDSGLAQLRLSYRLREVDLYLLLDMTNTMSGERDHLIEGLSTGNFYDGLAGAPSDCVDVDRDGLPDNQLKEGGVLGALRCLIGGVWVGTGYFRDVPYQSAGLGGVADEHVFRHIADLGPDVEPVLLALRDMQTNGNNRSAEAGALALWSLATGRGHYFGVDRPAVPDRVVGASPSEPIGCPEASFGFPCFREGRIPVVVVLTDAAFLNGPSGSGGSLSDFDVVGRSGSGAAAAVAPRTAEDFDSAYDVGDLRDNHYTVVGDTRQMRSDLPGALVGCGDGAAADAVFRFEVSGSGAIPAHFALLDDSHDQSPATDFPGLLALYGGVPAAVAAPLDLGDATSHAVGDGPDQRYLSFFGVTDGAGSQPGLLGGLSGCGADGASGQMAFELTPDADASIVIDAAASGFAAAVSLHEGAISELPPDPTPVPVANGNDEFASAAGIEVQGGYRSYLGDSGLNPSQIDDDYGPDVVGCGVNPATKDSVFSFVLSDTRNVRLDTEGSSIATTISLHDAPPPELAVTSMIEGNDQLPGHPIGDVSGVSLRFESGGSGTASLAADYSGLGCGSDDATPDAAYGLSLSRETDLHMSVAGQSGFQPVVALVAGLPSDIHIVDNSANTNTDQASALALGDLHVLQHVQIASGDTAAAGIDASYASAAVGCATDDAAPDAVVGFTVGADTTVRLEVEAASWDATIALFADSIDAGSRLACDGAEAGLEADVETGVEYYAVIKGQATVPAGAYVLDARALFRARHELVAGDNDNDTADSAFELPDPYRSRVRVDGGDTSATGIAWNYGPSALGCGNDARAPDAVYRMRSSLPTRVDVSLPSAGFDPVLALYDGPPLPAAQVLDLNALGNDNEDAPTARALDLSGVGQRAFGNTSPMGSDIASSLIGCGAEPGAHDAVFTFELAQQTDVDVSALSPVSPGVPPVVGLFRGAVAATPTPQVLANDSPSEADSAPDPSPDLAGAWLRYAADMADLTLSSQSAVSLDNSANDNSDTPFDLGDVFGAVVTVDGADTSAQSADYHAALMQCGGDDAAPDALYSFTSSQDTRVRVQVQPDSGFSDAVVALFDGSLGPPQLAAQAPSATDLDPDNDNETAALAHGVTVGALQSVSGDTSAMQSDLDGTLFDEAGGAQCSAAPGGADAFFAFSLSSPTTVEIDSAGTGFASTLALYDASAFPAPEAPVVMENDTLADANANPVGSLDGRWLALEADLGNLTNSALSPRAVDNSGNGNEDGATALPLDDLAGELVTVSGGDTSAMAGDHVLGCAASGSAPDAVYSLTPSVDVSLRATASAAGFSPRLALFDGLPGVASELACAPEQIDVDLTAGSTYFLVVKGDAVSDAGSYDLTLSAVTGAAAGCDEDLHGADAFYRLEVVEDRQVTLDTSGSTADTVLSIYDSGGALIACDDDGGADSASRVTASLAAGSYHAVVRPRVGSTGGQAIALSIRDDDALGALSCADGASATGASLSEALPVGDYLVALTEQSGATPGPYVVNFRDAGAQYADWLACDTATDTLEYDVSAGVPYYVVVKGGAAAAAGAYSLEVRSAGQVDDIGCGADESAPDAFYRFELSEQTRVRIDTEDSALDSVIALFPATTTVFDSSAYALDTSGDPVPCDDNSGLGETSRIEAELAPGAYYVVVKGDEAAWSGGELPFVLSLRDERQLSSIACAPAGATVTEGLAAGSYSIVVSGEQASAGGQYELIAQNRDVVDTYDGSVLGCAAGSALQSDIEAGRDYYVVIKGVEEADAGPYSLLVQDALSASGDSGSAPIACADEAGAIDMTLPAGDYFALVKGVAGGAGNYSLDVSDAQAVVDNNRLACDDDSGPNGTSAIEAELAPGTYYVVVKGDSPADVGDYQLNVRDLDAVPDGRLACGGAAEGSRIEADVVAGQDYTVLLKGLDGGQGAYDLKLYDADGVVAGDDLLACVGSGTDLDQSLDPGTYYLAVKGQAADDDGAFQLDLAHDAPGVLGDSVYEPASWSGASADDGTRQALEQAGLVVLPVMSGGSAAALDQARAIAIQTGALDAVGDPIVQQVASDGSDVSGGIVQAVATLADSFLLDIGVRAVYEPDPGASAFSIDVTALPSSPGCAPLPSGSEQIDCVPGALPEFDVTIENPASSPVPANSDDFMGGYHFRLELVGDERYVLAQVPVYVVPDLSAGPPPPGSFAASAQMSRDLVASGCGYFEAEGEGASDSSCVDGMDNDGDSRIDHGVDTDGDGEIDIPADDDCSPGSCADGVDNDGDGQADLGDPSCFTNERPNWSDIYFKASLPSGTQLDFEACSAETEEELDDCTPVLVSSIVGNGATCGADADCLGMPLGALPRDGFCGEDGRCQFITIQKRSGSTCTADLECENGSFQEFAVASSCDADSGECVYSTGPLDLASALPEELNYLPFLRLTVRLHANPDASRSPALYDWWLTYHCENIQ